MAAAVDTMVALLLQALREPLMREDLVAKFQALVWAGLDPSLPAAVVDVLRQLAYDLDFFEASSSVRAEDGSYFGHRRFAEEVQSALARLCEAGIEIGGHE